jgi:hypothetical protein
MAIRSISLGTSSNPARYGQDGNTRLINCYAEHAGAEGKMQWPLYASDGLTSFATLGTSEGVRAMLPLSSALYVVAGRLVYSVDLTGTATVLGGIPTDGPVYMAANSRGTGQQVGIASDGVFGVIDNGLFEIYQDDNLRGPNSLAVVDDYTLTSAGRGYWQVSAQNNMRSWDALETANAESYPDELVRIIAHEREAMLIGSESVEWWRNVGSADFSFARVATKQIGTVAGASAARVGETVLWIDHENQVRARSGYGGQVVSNNAVTDAISSVTDKSTIKGFGWARGKHSFYAIRHANWCWVYDLYTNFWHERRSHNSNTWRIGDVCRFAGKAIAADATTGTLYEMSDTAYDEAGQPLVMTVQPPSVHGYPRGVKINHLFVDAIAGVGAVSSDTDDSNPQLAVRHSFDGGNNWSAVRHESLGAAGQRLKRIKMRRFGKSREDGFQFELSVSAKVAKGITGMAVDAEPLRA